MKVKIIRRTAIDGVVVQPGKTVDVSASFADKLVYYGIAEKAPAQRVRKKAEVQDGFAAKAEVK